MTANQIISLRDYYTKKYGTPASDADAIDKLIKVYRELFDEIPTQEVKEGIAEYYRIISTRDLPAYLWLLESLHVTSKKEKSKRTFPYCVGMIRSWLKNGFGHIPNREEDELIEYFQEMTGYSVSPTARKLLQKLMGKYGLIKVTRMIGGLNKDADKSLVMMMLLELNMEEQYNSEVKVVGETNVVLAKHETA